MSAISITLTPGYQFAPGELLAYAKLNALGQPGIQLQGQLGTAQLEDGSVTTPILADNAVTAANIANDTFTPDGTGTAPFDTGFLSALYLEQDARPVQGRTNCLVVNAATSPTTQATITADELVLNDTNGNYFLATAVNQTVNITANGSSNGLDTLSAGAGTGAAASTWYYLYIIGDGTNLAGLISTSPTTPVMPGDFMYKCLVGAVFNNASSLFGTFRIVNRRAWVQEVNIFTATALTTSWAAYITNVNLALPSIAKRAYGLVGVTGSGGCGVAGDSAGMFAAYGAGAVGTAIDSFGMVSSFDVPMTTSQTLYVKSSGTAAINRLSVTGYEF